MVVTFFVDPDPRITASLLDNRRLGKQRVEAMQIVHALEGTGGWQNHPCARSWRGYLPALKEYHNLMIAEWIRRGKVNNMNYYPLEEEIVYPPWATNPRVLYSHMARLVAKDPIYYGDKFTYPPEYNDYGYIWPCKWTEEQLNTLTVAELGDPRPVVFICTASTMKGAPCNNVARYSGLCGVHRTDSKNNKKKLLS